VNDYVLLGFLWN